MNLISVNLAILRRAVDLDALSEAWREFLRGRLARSEGIKEGIRDER